MSPDLHRICEAVEVACDAHGILTCEADREAIAVAVLTAIRDPSPVMLRAICKSLSPGRRPTPAWVSVAEKHRIRWRAAVDALLLPPLLPEPSQERPMPEAKPGPGQTHIIIEAADSAGVAGSDWALTVVWADGSETIELVSTNAARLLGYAPELAGADAPAAALRVDFQSRVAAHLYHVCDEAGDPTDLPERRDRAGEEAIELQQALGATRAGLHALVDYVFDRPAGEPAQEMGGTMTTLAALATYARLDMMACGEAELLRTWRPEVVAKIRRKRANRHDKGTLPGNDADLVTASAEA